MAVAVAAGILVGVVSGALRADPPSTRIRVHTQAQGPAVTTNSEDEVAVKGATAFNPATAQGEADGKSGRGRRDRRGTTRPTATTRGPEVQSADGGGVDQTVDATPEPGPSPTTSGGSGGPPEGGSGNAGGSSAGGPSGSSGGGTSGEHGDGAGGGPWSGGGSSGSGGGGGGGGG